MATTHPGHIGRTAGPHAVRTRVAPTLAGRIVQAVGGRLSVELGIDLAQGAPGVERWFLAAALHGNPATSSVGACTFAVLESEGIHRIVEVEELDRGQLVALLRTGGCARHGARTAMWLQALSVAVRDRYGGVVAEIGRRFPDPRELEAALAALPGWGPITSGLFLRELRGVWEGARPSLDARAAVAARHLGLMVEGDGLGRLSLVARLAHCDERDLEGALVRVSQRHRRNPSCPGGRDCVVLRNAVPRRCSARRVELPGGRSLSIRPMQRGDARGIAALYAGLGEDDVYRRFFASRPPPARFVARMAAIGTRGGVGLVATVPYRVGEGDDRDGTTERAPRERIVAEATCEPLADGDGELGITVAAGIRGWLGPYLLDALLEEAATAWFPNLQADVLIANRPMLVTLRRRGMAVLRNEPQPAIVRVVVGTVGDVPSWSGDDAGTRVVVEIQGGRWYAETNLRKAGFHVVSCAGPPGGWASCPPMRGEPCPLAAEAAVVVNAVPAEARSPLLRAHRHVHPGVPVCAVLETVETVEGGGRRDGTRSGGVLVVPKGLPGSTIARTVRRMARAS